MRRVALALGVLISTAAWAKGDLPSRNGAESDPGETLEVLSEAHACPSRSGACVLARGTTRAAESQAVAALKKGSASAPRFARGESTAPWELELASTLKHQALAGNAVFLFFDLDDHDALANKEYTAMFQTGVHAGRSLGARLRLTTEDGFRAGHTYRLRVVQLVGGHEVTLVEADFSLL